MNLFSLKILNFTWIYKSHTERHVPLLSTPALCSGYPRIEISTWRPTASIEVFRYFSQFIQVSATNNAASTTNFDL
jgi:hypothetical protein